MPDDARNRGCAPGVQRVRCIHQTHGRNRKQRAPAGAALLRVARQCQIQQYCKAFKRQQEAAGNMRITFQRSEHKIGGQPMPPSRAQTADEAHKAGQRQRSAQRIHARILAVPHKERTEGAEGSRSQRSHPREKHAAEHIDERHINGAGHCRRPAQRHLGRARKRLPCAQHQPVNRRVRILAQEKRVGEQLQQRLVRDGPAECFV